MLKPIFSHIKATMQHKAFVWQAGVRLKVPLFQLFIHDVSKFLPPELFGYARRFYSDVPDVEGFAQAWLHHQNHNPHHWEYWLTRSGNNPGAVNGALVMPEQFVREMVADWAGASRAYKGHWSIREWYAQNATKMTLHPDTRAFVEHLIDIWEGLIKSKEPKLNTESVDTPGQPVRLPMRKIWM